MIKKKKRKRKRKGKKKKARAWRLAEKDAQLTDWCDCSDVFVIIKKNEKWKKKRLPQTPPALPQAGPREAHSAHRALFQWTNTWIVCVAYIYIKKKIIKKKNKKKRRRRKPAIAHPRPWWRWLHWPQPVRAGVCEWSSAMLAIPPKESRWPLPGLRGQDIRGASRQPGRKGENRGPRGTVGSQSLPGRATPRWRAGWWVTARWACMNQCPRLRR